MKKTLLLAALFSLAGTVKADDFTLNKLGAAGAAGASAGAPLPAPSRPAAAAGRIAAEGALFAYNKDTKKFDIRLDGRCSVTLENFRAFMDTAHGSPREVVSADYRLAGFPDLEKYAAGNATGSAPEAAFPYVTLENYYQSGLTKGVMVSIVVDGVPSAQALLARPVPPTEVFVSMEKSASSYFGGDGIKWGYWCNFRGSAAGAAPGPR